MPSALSTFLLILLLGSTKITLADRGPGSTPYSTATPYFTQTTHPLSPTAFWGSLKKPYPTGVHWTNAILDSGNLPTAALPYVSTPQPTGLTVSYPKITCSSPACFGEPTNDFTVGATGLSRRYVVDYDSLSWTMQWKVGAARDLETHLEEKNTLSTARSKAGTVDTHEVRSYRIAANSVDCVLNQSFVADLSNPDRWESSYPSYDCGTATPQPPPPTTPPTTTPPTGPPPTTPPVTPPVKPPTAPPPTSPPPTTPPPTPVAAPPPVGTEPGVITGVPSNAMTIHMVYGSPYLTVKYGNLVPVIASSNALLSVNGATAQGQFSGSKFILTYNTGNRWIVYVVGGSSITFTWSGNTLTASSSFTGVVRIAAAPTSSYDSMLDARVTPYAIAAKVSTSFSGNVGNYYYQWITEGGDASQLLMLTLPHHRDCMVGASFLSPSWTSLKGAMTPVIGATWTMSETLTDITWNARSAIDSTKVSQLNQALAADLANYPGIPQDTYSFGKVAARYARLVLIADQLGNTAARDNFLQRLINVMTPWMTGSAPGNSLLYDTTWGGTISSLGRANSGAEYGQAWYNDQHFHWGYFLYSAAVIAKYNSAWATQYKAAVNDLARGIGNPSPSDPYFPTTRHKDWFVSHSWASGLFSFGDAKNQESTSEAVNGYYGLYLWGLAIGDTNMRDMGRLLMAMEIRATKKYWHMFPTDTSIYSSVFAAHTCIGIVWNTKVDYATWFGLNVEYIHGIQMLPYTPITEDLLPKDWITVEYPLLATSLTRTDPVIQEGWRGFVFMTQAIINKEAAWNSAQTLTSYDNGNSQTNTLYWIATRPT